MSTKEKPLPKDQQPDVRRIVGHWPIGEIIDVVDYSNQGAHGGVVKISTKTTDFSLKRYDAYTGKKVPFFHEVYRSLLRGGFQNFPQPLATRSGENFVVDESGSVWEVVPWIAGKSASTLPLNPAMVSGITELVGSFHQAGMNYSPDASSVIDRRHSDTWIPEMLARRQKVKEAEDVGFGEAHIDALVAELSRLSEYVIPQLTSEKFALLEDTLPSSVIHADLSFDHILFDGNVYQMIDFDRMRVGKRLVDIERLITESSQFDPKLGNVAADEYRSRFGLSASEEEVLPLFIAYQRIRRAYWRAERLSENPVLMSNEQEHFKNELALAVSYLGQNF